MTGRQSQRFFVPSSTRMTTRDNTTKVEGMITEETEKAVLLKLESGHENWQCVLRLSLLKKY